MSAILTYREHVIITMVYKLEMSQADIAKSWGMSQQRVSQIIECALAKMQAIGGFSECDVEFCEIN